ncbi:MAG: MarR family transcriptional regulator [Methanobrevibacter sp.]|nr:MarR family transcriptional regulator [Methanobrevibacter sp.]
MSLEEFKCLDASVLPIGKLISMISRGQQIYLNHNLKDLGINSSQLNLLFEISHQKDINQEKIATRCNINKGAVARSIKKLEEKELVVREIDQENRRQNKISLTSEGKRVLTESIEILNKWEDGVLKDYSDNEIELLKKTLKELVINTIELNKKGESNE